MTIPTVAATTTATTWKYLWILHHRPFSKGPKRTFKEESFETWLVQQRELYHKKQHLFHKPDGLSVQTLDFPRAAGRWQCDAGQCCPAPPVSDTSTAQSHTNASEWLLKTELKKLSTTTTTSITTFGLHLTSLSFTTVISPDLLTAYKCIKMAFNFADDKKRILHILSVENKTPICTFQEGAVPRLRNEESSLDYTFQLIKPRQY